MKKIVALTLLLNCVSLIISAQQPVFDPKKANTSGQKDIKPDQLKAPPQKISFKAIITEPRSAVPSYEDGNVIARYSQILWNEANGLDAAKGTFTAPTQGLYCFIATFAIAKYGCVGNEITYSVSALKNGTQPIESFNLPVQAGSIDASTSESIMFTVQLNANDKITLRPAAIACEGGHVPMINRVVFSGFKVY